MALQSIKWKSGNLTNFSEKEYVYTTQVDDGQEVPEGTPPDIYSLSNDESGIAVHAMVAEDRKYNFLMYDGSDNKYMAIPRIVCGFIHDYNNAEDCEGTAFQISAISTEEQNYFTTISPYNISIFKNKKDIAKNSSLVASDSDEGTFIGHGYIHIHNSFENSYLYINNWDYSDMSSHMAKGPGIIIKSDRTDGKELLFTDRKFKATGIESTNERIDLLDKSLTVVGKGIYSRYDIANFKAGIKFINATPSNTSQEIFDSISFAGGGFSFDPYGASPLNVTKDFISRLCKSETPSIGTEYYSSLAILTYLSCNEDDNSTFGSSYYLQQWEQETFPDYTKRIFDPDENPRSKNMENYWKSNYAEYSRPLMLGASLNMLESYYSITLAGPNGTIGEYDNTKAVLIYIDADTVGAISKEASISNIDKATTPGEYYITSRTINLPEDTITDASLTVKASNTTLMQILYDMTDKSKVTQYVRYSTAATDNNAAIGKSFSSVTWGDWMKIAYVSE